MSGGFTTTVSPSGESPRAAYEIVGPEIDSMTNYANNAYNQSVVFLDSLLGFISEGQVSNINVNLEEVDVDTPPLSLPPTPTAPDITLNLPNLPADFVPNNIAGIDLNAIGAIPTFTVSDPTINIPAAPNPFSGTAPGPAPVINDSFTFPDSPTAVLPDVPTFSELSIPTPPTLSIPSFNETLPSASSVVVPNSSFSWGEESPFSDECLTAVKTKLCDWLGNGGTGLLPHIEQAIYDRGRNREDIGSVRGEHQILTEQASRGFSRPQGSTYAALDYATQESQNKIADLSREIMIKQAEMEQENIHFAVQQTIALEQLLISEHHQIQTRSFEAARFIQEVSINLYNAEIAKVTIELEAFKAFSSSYEARVRAALSQVEIFKAEIEAQSLISEVNKNSIDLYLSQIEGIKSSVDIFKVEVEAVHTQISAEGLKVANFKGLVESYSAEAQAKKMEFEAFGEAVKAELGKADIFDSQVKAFIGRVDAYGKSVGAQSELVDSNIDVEDLRLKSYLAQLEAVIKQTASETSIYRAAVDIYRGEAAMYQAEVGANVAASELEIKEADIKLQMAVAQANISIKNAEVNLANASSVDTLRLEAIKSGADISKGLAQASLSAVSIGASVSSSGHDQTNRSSNYNENHDYQEK